MEKYIATLKDEAVAAETQLNTLIRTTEGLQNQDPTQTVFCCFYARKRRCRNGDFCPYVHEGNRRVRNLMNNNVRMCCERTMESGYCRHKAAEHHP